MFRGIEGFGVHQSPQCESIFVDAESPILIEVVDDEEKWRALVPELERVIGEGLVTFEAASYLRLQRQHKAAV